MERREVLEKPVAAVLVVVLAGSQVVMALRVLLIPVVQVAAGLPKVVLREQAEMPRRMAALVVLALMLVEVKLALAAVLVIPAVQGVLDMVVQRRVVLERQEPAGF